MGWSVEALETWVKEGTDARVAWINPGRPSCLIDLSPSVAVHGAEERARARDDLWFVLDGSRDCPGRIWDQELLEAEQNGAAAFERAFAAARAALERALSLALSLDTLPRMKVDENAGLQESDSPLDWSILVIWEPPAGQPVERIDVDVRTTFRAIYRAKVIPHQDSSGKPLGRPYFSEDEAREIVVKHLRARLEGLSSVPRKRVLTLAVAAEYGADMWERVSRYWRSWVRKVARVYCGHALYDALVPHKRRSRGGEILFHCWLRFVDRGIAAKRHAREVRARLFAPLGAPHAIPASLLPFGLTRLCDPRIKEAQR